MLQRNYSMPPNGVTPAAVPNAGLEVYESGGAGNPSALIDGILFSGGSVRVAVRDNIPYTFGKVVGFDQRMIVGRAQVAFNGNLLPIAVRNYVNAPGTSSGAYPCVDDQRAFMDFFSTANTACIGTDVNASLRTEPTAGAAFSSSHARQRPRPPRARRRDPRPGRPARQRGRLPWLRRARHPELPEHVVADLLQRRADRNDLAARSRTWRRAGSTPAATRARRS